jgi:hypothetical protein
MSWQRHLSEGVILHHRNSKDERRKLAKAHDGVAGHGTARNGFHALRTIKRNQQLKSPSKDGLFGVCA